MTQALYVLLALAIGFASALQVGMIASLGRLRGPTEATWISVLASFLGLALIFGARSLWGEPPALPSPFRNAFVFLAIGAAGGVALLVSMRGLQPYLALSGVIGFAYVAAAALIAPRTGIALYTGAVTAGALVASVALDHVGAFGGDVQRVSPFRVLGVLALLLGVLLVRHSR